MSDKPHANLSDVTFPIELYIMWDELEGKARPSVVQAYETDSRVLVAHENPREYLTDPSLGGPWNVSHIPSGITLWADAASLQEARAFVDQFREFISDEVMIGWEYDPLTKTPIASTGCGLEQEAFRAAEQWATILRMTDETKLTSQ